MRFARLLLPAVLLSAGILPAQYQLGGHPRVFLNPRIIKELAAEAYGGGRRAADYALVKAEADSVVSRGALRNLNSPWNLQTDMFCACLAFLIERELGNPSAASYAEAVKKAWGDGQVLDMGVDPRLFRELGGGGGDRQFGSFGIAFDWIYDSFTAEERLLYGNHLGTWLYYYTDTPAVVLRNGGWLYNKTWGPAHLGTMDCRDGITPKMFVALALAGAGTEHEAACKQFLDSCERRIPVECIPFFDLAGGVWPESMGHGNYGPVKSIPWAFEAWRTATGQDWFQLGIPTSYLKEMNLWAVYLSLPFNNRTAYIDDNTSPDFLPRTMQWVAPILGARYHDPVANWVSRSLDDTADSNRVPWLRFIAYDYSTPAKDPAQAGWPTARLFTGAGHVYLRSSWNNPEATWAFFGAGPSYANHSRDDEGHFLIARKGWLVLRAGGAGHNDYDYYAGGSMPFNIVTIFDPNEEFRRVTPGSMGGTKNERDGGIVRHVYEGPHDEVKERGRITAFTHNNRFTYAAADLTTAYRSNKAAEVTRQFLFLRGEREFFVIFDRVEAKNAGYPKHWFLHVPDEPAVSGSQTELIPEHVYSYTDAGQATWLSSLAGNETGVLTSGRSRAFLRFLLPSGARVTKRGGAGYDFWGHPEEPTAQYNHTGRGRNSLPRVPWRLEVAAPVGQARQYFLHVLEIGDEQDTQISEISLLDADTTQAGVRINPSAGEPVEVFFSKRDSLTAKIRFGGQGAFQELPSVLENQP